MVPNVSRFCETWQARIKWPSLLSQWLGCREYKWSWSHRCVIKCRTTQSESGEPISELSMLLEGRSPDSAGASGAPCAGGIICSPRHKGVTAAGFSQGCYAAGRRRHDMLGALTSNMAICIALHELRCQLSSDAERLICYKRSLILSRTLKAPPSFTGGHVEQETKSHIRECISPLDHQLAPDRPVTAVLIIPGMR